MTSASETPITGLSPDVAGHAAPGPLALTLAMFERLQQKAQAQGIGLRPPPQPPVTCCARGCNGCVWEGFYAAAQYWREEAELSLLP